MFSWQFFEHVGRFAVVVMVPASLFGLEIRLKIGGMSALVRIVARLAAEIALLGPVANALLSATASAAFSASCMGVSVASARSLLEFSSSIRGIVNAQWTVRSLVAKLITLMTLNSR